jgi:DNA (cytosine-5)-methyltransferase 1
VEKWNLISLFAGAGGLDLGLEMAGMTTCVANEIETHICETLRQNQAIAQMSNAELDAFIAISLQQRCYKNLSPTEQTQLFARIKKRPKATFLTKAEIIEGDIRNISSRTFREAMHGGKLFCIAGGPPCQPFSKAGKQKSLDCSKNGDLFFEFVRLVHDLKPTWFVFENVKGLTFTRTDVLYSVCSTCRSLNIAPFPIRQNFKAEEIASIPCEVCGSEKTHWQINNEPGGSLKIILNEFQKVGYTCTTAVLNAADFGAPQIRERLFIVGNINGKQLHWPSPTHTRSEAMERHQIELFDQENLIIKPWVGIYDALWRDGHPKYGDLNKSTAELWVKNVVRPHDEPVTWGLERPAPTIGAHQGAKLALAPFGVPEAQLFRQQWHTEGRRQGDTPPVLVEHSYLTDEELLTLQTFPAWWYLHGTRMERAFQIGNAVPPILAKAIGEAILYSERHQ